MLILIDQSYQMTSYLLLWLEHCNVFCLQSINDLKLKIFSVQKHRLRLIATDGVFSMDGDIAPLRGICDLAKRYNALVFIDECHATGFMGPNGR